MRRLASNFAAVCAIVTLVAMGLGGCGNGREEHGGAGGDGGSGGVGGSTACEGPEDCDDLNDCTKDACDLVEATCSHAAVQDDTSELGPPKLPAVKPEK